MPVGTPEGRVDPETFVHVAAKLQETKNATEWRVVNSYFYRSLASPTAGRKIIEQKMVEMKGLELTSRANVALQLSYIPTFRKVFAAPSQYPSIQAGRNAPP